MVEPKQRCARILMNVNLACIMKYSFKKPMKLDNVTVMCCDPRGGWLSTAAKSPIFGSNYYIYFLLRVENIELDLKSLNKKVEKGRQTSLVCLVKHIM